jgi:prevent-host-death family protein
MRSINIHEAKTHLSKLIDKAVNGEPFIIAKSGKPMVKVVQLDAPEPGSTRRLGFLSGQIEVPEDFDRMGQEEVEQIFFGGK